MKVSLIKTLVLTNGPSNRAFPSPQDQAIHERARTTCSLLSFSLTSCIASLVPRSPGHTDHPSHVVGEQERPNKTQIPERITEHCSGDWPPKILLTIASKNIKHLWINLTKYMLNQYHEKYKIFPEKVKDLKMKVYTFMDMLNISKYYLKWESQCNLNHHTNSLNRN